MNALEKNTGQRTAKLFRNGRSQAVRIPKELEISGEEVLIERLDDGKLILTPVEKRLSLLEVLASLEPLPAEDSFPDMNDDDLLPLDDIKL
ncbi:AbrB/MazE/SpoVT family DNA-binding domain-containing protein [Corticibacterium sp. UT-5YL-CI-8]|nr:AbrB/MazE/SpoVT family DNA-binding domain-containing protein [Tianweitania sp. UT-5YL-CI-8]